MTNHLYNHRDKIDSEVDSSTIGEYSDLLKDMPKPDTDVAMIIATALPQSLLTDTDAMQSALADINSGNEPQWYEDMPDNAKEYVSEVQDFYASATSNGDVPASTDSSSSDDSEDSSDSDSEGATSTGGAPAPTGAVMASFAGVVGVLGLAVAL